MPFSEKHALKNSITELKEEATRSQFFCQGIIQLKMLSVHLHPQVNKVMTGKQAAFQVFFHLSVIKTRLSLAFLVGNWLITVIFILRIQASNQCSEKPYNMTTDQSFIRLDAFRLPHSFLVQVEPKIKTISKNLVKRFQIGKP